MAITIDGTGTITGATTLASTVASPTFTTPALGTPASGILTSCTGYAAAGTVLQIVNFQTGAVATGTTTTPADDTIPQNTEGTQFMTFAITPLSATSKLLITVVFSYGCSTNDLITVALFQDNIANAIATNAIWIGGSSIPGSVSFAHYMTSGTTSSTTFKVRAGANTSGTITFNGVSGGRYYGGSYASSITITEVVV